MPALDFRAFAAGFATQAQKIEEESAKIGMDLLKKAMEDFREEAKDYKPKYEEEIRNKKEQATYLRSTFGLSDTQVKVLLDRGDLGVKDFVTKAEKAKNFQQLEDYKGLVKLAEAQEPITGFDVIDYIDSGAYVKTKAPVYVGPEGFKTGVFGREVSLGDKSTVEATKSAYIPEKGGYEGDVPSSMGATVDLTSELKRGAFEPFDATSAAPKRIKAQIALLMQQASGVAVKVDPITNEYRFLDSSADVNAKLVRDTEKAYRNWYSYHEGENKKLDENSVYDFAVDHAMGELQKELDTGKVTPDTAFYSKAPDLRVDNLSAEVVGGSTATGTQTPSPAPATPAVTQATPSNVPTDPKQHPIIRSLIPAPTQTQIQSGQGSSRRLRIAKIKNILIQEYGYTDMKKAEADATAMVL